MLICFQVIYLHRKVYILILISRRSSLSDSLSILIVLLIAILVREGEQSAFYAPISIPMSDRGAQCKSREKIWSVDSRWHHSEALQPYPASKIWSLSRHQVCKTIQFPSHITDTNIKTRFLGTTKPSKQSLMVYYTWNNRPFLVEGFKVVKQRDMASTACFLHHHALATPARSTSSSQRQVVNLKPAHGTVSWVQLWLAGKREGKIGK
jgi:photosystem II oxygen-evolving enhancer protein 2